MVKEQIIQDQIRVALSNTGVTVFRINVGSVRLPDGRWFQTGVPAGFPDLVGFRHSDGKIFFIEVKNEKGRPRPDQIQFHEFLQKYGVIHGIARSPEQAVEIVTKGLVGYGFKDFTGA